MGSVCGTPAAKLRVRRCLALVPPRGLLTSSSSSRLSLFLVLSFCYSARTRHMESLSWISREELEILKRKLGIPLEDTSQDARLLHALTQSRVWIEAYLGQRYGQRGVEATALPAREGRVKDAVSLIAAALREVINWELAMQNPAFVEQEGRKLQSWLVDAGEQLQKD